MHINGMSFFKKISYMTPRSKTTRLKRLENQKLRLTDNPVKYENLEKRIQTVRKSKK